jgi:hypothetical protein
MLAAKKRARARPQRFDQRVVLASAPLITSRYEWSTAWLASGYTRGSPSPLTRTHGNLHNVNALRKLRQALYARLGVERVIECFPVWNSEGACAESPPALLARVVHTGAHVRRGPRDVARK